MTETSPSAEPDARRRWSRWHLIALERLRIRYRIVAAILILATAVEQAIEYLLGQRFAGVAPAFRIGDALVIIGFVIFVLIYMRALKLESITELWKLRPSVKVSDEVYDEHVRHLLQADWRVELALVAVSALIGLVFYGRALGGLIGVIVQWSWAGPVLVILVGCVYLLLFWLLLMLAYTGIRYGRALAALAHCPLVTNTFDNSHLLPFGRLSLLVSLWLVGLVLIPLVTLGLPTSGGYLIMALSGISLLALFIPLWGVHRQMVQAKFSMLIGLHEKYLKIQEALLQQADVGADEIKALADRASQLSGLHKMIQESPTWPFASSSGILRAALASASPLIYFFLNQLILNFLVPLLKR